MQTNMNTSPFSNSGSYEPQNFREFLYHFFNDKEFQLRHIEFPLNNQYIDDEFIERKRLINKQEWTHLEGPPHYRCEVSCYDILIYDNFEKRMEESGERVLALEGVDNGINESLYFALKNKQWTLVKYEQFSN